MNIISQNNGISYSETGKDRLFLGLVLKGHEFVETIDVLSVTGKTLHQVEMEMLEYNNECDENGMRVRGLVACSMRDLTDPVKFGKVVTRDGKHLGLSLMDDFQADEDWPDED